MKIVNNMIRIAVQKGLKNITRKAEPEILHRYNRQGNSYWLVFDPTTRSYSYFSTELEVKIWLEQRYYSQID